MILLFSLGSVLVTNRLNMIRNSNIDNYDNNNYYRTATTAAQDWQTVSTTTELF